MAEKGDLAGITHWYISNAPTVDDINARHIGKTALMKASTNGHKDVVGYLVGKGADKEIKSYFVSICSYTDMSMR